MWYCIGLSSWERRACLVASIRVASYRRWTPTTLNHSVNHARSGSNSCSASLAPWLIATSPLPALPLCPSHDFHGLSRAFRPSCNQLRKSSSAASQPIHIQFGPVNPNGVASAIPIRRRKVGATARARSVSTDRSVRPWTWRRDVERQLRRCAIVAVMQAADFSHGDYASR
jgi:hypothetical protein